MACYEAVARRACLPLEDASLDRRRQNAYKSAHRGEALRLRGAPQTPGTHAACRGASIPRTPRCARRDCYAIRRCRKGVDLVLDRYPKLIAIDEETNDQIVHRRRFGKADRATHETLDPCPQIDVFTLNSLRVLLAHVMLRWVDMPLVSTPAISVETADPKGLQQSFQLQKDR